MDLPMICIVGPTGAGKSSLALRLALVFSGEIVNCDSLQLYRGFDIGSAKTPVAERLGVPHHLLDALEADFVFSAGDYSREARAVLREITGRGRLPVVTGGTGFYLRALLDGLPPLPVRDDALRERLMQREPAALHRILQRIEPSAAARIHAQDTQKLIRALEIRLLTGRALPDRAEGTPLSGYRVLQIGLAPEREKLVEAITRRTRCMFETGLVEEVRGLLASGLSGNEKPFEALGYKQVLQHLMGQLSEAEAITATEIGTRQYAKRQMTWFRRDPSVRWINGFGSEERSFEQAADWVREFTGVD